MEELRDFKLEDLYDRLLNWSDEDFVEWFQTLRLLHSKRYVWRKKFRGNDVFFHLWSEIAVQYVCESEMDV